MKKILAILVGLSVLSFVMAGCGSKTEDPAAPASPKAGDATPKDATK